MGRTMIGAAAVVAALALGFLAPAAQAAPAGGAAGGGAWAWLGGVLERFEQLVGFGPPGDEARPQRPPAHVKSGCELDPSGCPKDGQGGQGTVIETPRRGAPPFAKAGCEPDPLGCPKDGQGGEGPVLGAPRRGAPPLR